MIYFMKETRVTIECSQTLALQVLHFYVVLLAFWLMFLPIPSMYRDKCYTGV